MTENPQFFRKKNKRFKGNQSNSYEKICEEEERLSKLIFGDTEGILPDLPNKNENSGDVECEEESAPAWEDEDDDDITIGDALKSQKRNLIKGGLTQKTNKYAHFLKRKYTDIVGTPDWAKLNKKEKSDQSDDEILQTCGFIDNIKEIALAKGILEYKKLKDLNIETYSEGPFVNSVEFHPTATVGLVAGHSGIFSLFAVDGKRNNKLHSVKLNNFPIKCAKFNMVCNEIILGSLKNSYYYVFNLDQAQTQRIFLPEDVTSMQRFTVSPNGNYIAIFGRFGQVFILDAKSKEKIYTFKQDTKVRALSFTPDDQSLYAHSESGKVSVWDMGTQRIVNQWYDDGCIQGSHIDVSPCGQFVATGSFEGVVNIYERESLIVESPKPKKTLLNLTTCISGLKFSPTSEILAFSSFQKDGALKLLHMNSQTVFSNFPGMDKDIYQVNSMAFSPASGYFAFGNNKSKVLLYRLKHFSNY